jgi:hypothetical protein
MSTKFLSPGWRMPRNANQSKSSNYSLDFDGASYIDLGNSSLGLTANSISIWFKTTSTTSGQQLLSKYGSTYQFQFRLETNGTITLYSFENQSTFATLQSASGYNDGNWHNVTTTFNTTDGHKMYVDGNTTPVDTDTANKSALQSSSERMLIGARDSSTGVIDTARYFNGNISFISIFDYALSSSQVTTLYGNSSNGPGNPMALSSPPIAYYPLGGSAGAFQTPVNNNDKWLIENNAIGDYVFSFNANYVDLGDSDDFSFTNGSGQDLPFTLSAWVNMNDASSFRIITKYGTNTEWYLYTTGSDILRFRTNDSSTGEYIGRGYSTAMTSYENQWIHIVGTYDGSESNSGFKLYINATKVDDTDAGSSGTYNGMINSTDTVKIGKMTGSDVTNGKMSNVQIFNTALPATGSNSVETLYNNGSPLTSMTGFTSLQGWWKLDASATYNSSTTTWTIPDDSTNSNDGTSSGMTQSNLVQSDLQTVAPYSKYAMNFDGTDDLITISNESNFDFDRTDSFSISCWFKCDNVSANNHIINKLSSTGDYTGYNLFINNTDSKLWFYLRHNYTSPNQIIIKSDSALVSNVWYNLVVTYDGSSTAAGCKMYIDNVNVSTTESDTLSSSILNNEPLRIGGRSPSTTNFANGSISNVSVWNTALTVSQVSEIYNEGLPGNLNSHSAYSNLVSWWQLGENSSFNGNYWICADEKGTNNGESNGMGVGALVNGVGTTANGTSNGMAEGALVGNAPYSTANAISSGMAVTAKGTDVPS